MRDQLLAYLFDDLPPEQRKRIEHHLQHDPTWQHEYEKLKQCIEAHEEPPEKTTSPPPDLLQRTCKLVNDSSIQAKGSPTQLSEARECCDQGKRWSILDLVVAGAILLGIASLLLPALVESRRTARRTQCEDNLKEIAAALFRFHDAQRQGLPHVEFEENAGIFVVKLAESGAIDRQQLAHLLVCPSTQLADDVFQGTVVMKVPTRQALADMDPESLADLRARMAGSYAYQFGFVDPNDEKEEYQPMPFVGRSDVPMLGDKPQLTDVGWRSSNHGDCGQNIVHQDGSSRFTSGCEAKSSIGHPFLNDEGQHAAGRGTHDAVLGRSEATPAGFLMFTKQQ